MKNMKMKRFGASIAAGAIVLPTLLGVNAFAQDQLGTEADIDRTAIESIINSDITTADLTIHKYLNDVPGAPSDGTEIEDTSALGEAFEAEFTVYRIGDLDPKILADWQTYASLSGADYDATNNTLGGTALTEVAQVTTTNGSATENLPLGFYYVVETPQQGVSAAAPFAVALPMTMPDNSTWNYDVHVYPKNQEFGIEKQVSDAYATAGSEIEYTLIGDTIAIPQNMTGYERYIIVDRQPANITVDPASAQVALLINNEVSETLVAGEGGDFTAIAGATAGDTKIELTPAGLEKLTAARGGEGGATLQVQVTLGATVNGTPEANFPANEGSTPIVETNTTYLYVDNGLGDPDNPTPEDPQDQVESRFGQVTLNKTGSDTNEALPGAVFQLYRCAPSTGDDATDEPQTIDGPLTVNGANEWTTDEEGRIVITGLQVDDYRNGGVGADDLTDTFDYCFLETESPEGYELLPDPVPVDISDANPVGSVDIANVPDNGGNDLPFTGAQGYALFGVAGLTLIAGAGAIAMKSKKDNASA